MVVIFTAAYNFHKVHTFTVFLTRLWVFNLQIPSGSIMTIQNYNSVQLSAGNEFPSHLDLGPYKKMVFPNVSSMRLILVLSF